MKRIIGVFLLFLLAGCGNEESSIKNEESSIKDEGFNLLNDRVVKGLCESSSNVEVISYRKGVAKPYYSNPEKTLPAYLIGYSYYCYNSVLGETKGSMYIGFSVDDKHGKYLCLMHRGNESDLLNKMKSECGFQDKSKNKENKGFIHDTPSTSISPEMKFYEKGLSAKLVGKKMIGLYFDKHEDKIDDNYWSGCDNPVKERVEINSVTTKDQSLITSFNTNSKRWGAKNYYIDLSILPDQSLPNTLIKKGTIVNIIVRGCGSGDYPTILSIETI